MKKEITMSIHDFMEIQRGNKTIENIINNNVKDRGFNKIQNNTSLLLISIIMFFSNTIPPISIGTTVPITQVTEEGIKIIYITTVVLVQCFYELAINTVSML